MLDEIEVPIYKEIKLDLMPKGHMPVEENEAR